LLDLLVIHPGDGASYQDLGELTAIEPPLWARLIAGYCRDRGWDVAIQDEQIATFKDLPEARLYCVVAYGHQPNASTHTMPEVLGFTADLREMRPDAHIILVGGHVAALPERTLRESQADWVCTGEGPATVHLVLLGLQGKMNQLDVLGLGWLHNGLYRANKAALLIGPKELHGRAWDLLPSLDNYSAHNWQCFDGSPRSQYASIYTSLGCPYACVFCCINAPFGGHAYRMRDPADVIDEVSYLYRMHDVKIFKITDEMFVLNKRHYTAICEGLAALPFASELNIWAYARIDTVKKEDLELFRRAGIRWLALGIESGSEHVRDGADKPIDKDDIHQVVSDIKSAGIRVIGNFIYGLPDDTVETMIDTTTLAMGLNCEFANFYSAMAYPGSPLWLQTPPGDLPPAWSGFSQHSYDCQPLPTAKLTSDQVVGFRDASFNAYYSNPRYLEMVSREFGYHARRQIEQMTEKKLKRAYNDKAA